MTKAELRPYIKLIKTRMLKNQTSPLWEHSAANWRATVDHAKGILAYFASGRAGSRYERLAAIEVVKLGDHVEPLEMLEVTWGMYLMQDSRPRRFASDDAFRLQLVRRIRGLTDLNAGKWFDHHEGRVKRVYRELAPGAAKIVARWLAAALGGLGIYLAQLERRQRDEEREKAAVIVQAMKELR